MPSINDITQGSQYRGDANLAGGNWGVFQADLSAWQRFSDYTFLHNQEKAKAKNEEFKNQASQLAAALKVDWSKLRPEHLKRVTEKYDELKNFIQDNPTALDKPGSKEFVKFHSLSNDLNNITKAATERSTEIAATLGKMAEAAKSEEQLATWEKDFYKDIDGSDPYKPIQPFKNYLKEPIDWGKSTTFQNDKVTKDGNYIESDIYTGVDMANTEIVAPTLHINKGTVEEKEFKALKDMADNFNEIVGVVLRDPKSGLAERDKNGNFLRFSQKALNDPNFGRLLRPLQAWNDNADQYLSANPGAYVNYINPDGGGITDNDLKKVFMLAHTQSKYESKLHYTGAATSGYNAQTSRISANKPTGGGGGGGQTQGVPNLSLHSAIVNYIGSSTGTQKGVSKSHTYIPYSRLPVDIREALESSQGQNLKNITDQGDNLWIGADANGNLRFATADPKKTKAGGNVALTVLPGLSKDILDATFLGKINLSKSDLQSGQFNSTTTTPGGFQIAPVIPVKK